MGWKRLLSYISGSVDQELLLRNEYILAENRILRQQIKGRPHLIDAERKTLAEIGKQLGRKALEEVATLVKPETILGWHRRLIAKKFDGSKSRAYLGRPNWMRNWRNGWYALRGRIGPGDTIVLQGLSPIWGTPSATRRWGIS